MSRSFQRKQVLLACQQRVYPTYTPFCERLLGASVPQLLERIEGNGNALRVGIVTVDTRHRDSTLFSISQSDSDFHHWIEFRCSILSRFSTPLVADRLRRQRFLTQAQHGIFVLARFSDHFLSDAVQEAQRRYEGVEGCYFEQRDVSRRTRALDGLWRNMGASQRLEEILVYAIAGWFLRR